MTSAFSHGSSSAWAPRGTSHKIKIKNSEDEEEVCHTLWAQTVPNDYSSTNEVYGSSTKKTGAKKSEEASSQQPQLPTTTKPTETVNPKQSKAASQLPPIPSPPRNQKLEKAASKGTQSSSPTNIKVLVSPTSHAITRVAVTTGGPPTLLTSQPRDRNFVSKASSVVSSANSRLKKPQELSEALNADETVMDGASSVATGSVMNASTRTGKSRSTAASTRLSSLRARLDALEEKTSKLFSPPEQPSSSPTQRNDVRQETSPYVPTFNTNKDILSKELVVLKEMLSNKMLTEQVRQRQRAELARMGKI